MYTITILHVQAPRKTSRYYPSSYLSLIVMASAFILLLLQFFSWREAFVRGADGKFRVGTTTYSNGFRYLNWCIDVPCLLIQLTIVAQPDKTEENSTLQRNFTIAGLLMVLLGYVGQFYEDEGEMTTLIIFGAAACVPFLYVLYAATTVLVSAYGTAPKNVHWIITTILCIFYASWAGAYTLAYFAPAMGYNVESVIIRTGLYTAADILSKVIYGVLLTWWSNECVKREATGEARAEAEAKIPGASGAVAPTAAEEADGKDGVRAASEA